MMFRRRRGTCIGRGCSTATPKSQRRRLCAVALFLSAFPIGLSSAGYAGTVKVPDNAHAKNYGSGWECDKGFREKKRECAAIKVPDNAFPTKSNYGQGWECSWGFRQEGALCAVYKIPKNAFLNSFGDKWKCDRGYRARGDECEKIIVPDNAHLDFSGNGWQCNRPFRRFKDKCGQP